jgi:hypothetical protein
MRWPMHRSKTLNVRNGSEADLTASLRRSPLSANSRSREPHRPTRCHSSPRASALSARTARSNASRRNHGGETWRLQCGEAGCVGAAGSRRTIQLPPKCKEIRLMPTDRQINAGKSHPFSEAEELAHNEPEISLNSPLYPPLRFRRQVSRRSTPPACSPGPFSSRGHRGWSHVSARGGRSHAMQACRDASRHSCHEWRGRPS